MAKRGHSSKIHKDLPNKKNKTNWVEQSGGLPSYIERIAKHLHNDSGMSVSHAIASAVNTVKRWARGGGNVTPATKAKAAKAVAQWNAKRAAAKARRGTSNVDVQAIELAKEPKKNAKGEELTESGLIFNKAKGEFRVATDAEKDDFEKKHPRAKAGSADGTGGQFIKASEARDDRGDKAQKNKTAAANYEKVMKSKDFKGDMSKLNDKDLQDLSEYLYSFKSADKSVVERRLAIAAELKKRGKDVNDFGGLGKGRPSGKSGGSSSVTAKHAGKTSIKYGDIPEKEWDALLAAGWKGKAGDSEERIYNPKKKTVQASHADVRSELAARYSDRNSGVLEFSATAGLNSTERSMRTRVADLARREKIRRETALELSRQQTAIDRTEAALARSKPGTAVHARMLARLDEQKSRLRGIPVELSWKDQARYPKGHPKGGQWVDVPGTQMPSWVAAASGFDASKAKPSIKMNTGHEYKVGQFVGGAKIVGLAPDPSQKYSFGTAVVHNDLKQQYETKGIKYLHDAAVKGQQISGEKVKAKPTVPVTKVKDPLVGAGLSQYTESTSMVKGYPITHAGFKVKANDDGTVTAMYDPGVGVNATKAIQSGDVAKKNELIHSALSGAGFDVQAHRNDSFEISGTTIFGMKKAQPAAPKVDTPKVSAPSVAAPKGPVKKNSVAYWERARDKTIEARDKAKPGGKIWQKMEDRRKHQQAMIDHMKSNNLSTLTEEDFAKAPKVDAPKAEINDFDPSEIDDYAPYKKTVKSTVFEAMQIAKADAAANGHDVHVAYTPGSDEYVLLGSMPEKNAYVKVEPDGTVLWANSDGTAYTTNGPSSAPEPELKSQLDPELVENAKKKAVAYDEDVYVYVNDSGNPSMTAGFEPSNDYVTVHPDGTVDDPHGLLSPTSAPKTSPASSYKMQPKPAVVTSTDKIAETRKVVGGGYGTGGDDAVGPNVEMTFKDETTRAIGYDAMHPEVRQAFEGTPEGRAMEASYVPSYWEITEHFKQSGAIDKISASSKNAIYAYMGSHSTSVNHALRGILGGIDKTSANRVKHIDAAMKAYRTREPMIVNRGVSVSAVPKENMTGKAFQDPAYWSTSSDKGFGGQVRMHLFVPAGSHAIPAHGIFPGGSDTKHAAGGPHSNEHEVLLPRGTTIAVSKDETVNGVRHITATVVPVPADTPTANAAKDVPSASSVLQPAAYSAAGMEFLRRNGRVKWAARFARDAEIALSRTGHSWYDSPIITVGKKVTR